MNFWLSVSKVGLPFLPYIVFIVLVILGIALLILILWLLYKFFKNLPAIFLWVKGVFLSSPNKVKKINKKSMKVLLPGEMGAIKIHVGLKRFFKSIKQSSRSSNKTIYDISFVLAIGAPNTLLVASSLLSQSSGAIDLEEADEDTVIFWSFGDLIVIQPSEKILQQRSSFTYLLTLIQKYRYQRPLDGVLLFEDQESIANTFVNYDYLMERQKSISSPLRVLQNKYNIVLPLYFITFGLEKIEGFDDFLMIGSAEVKNQIIGWSNKQTSNFITEEEINEGLSDVVDGLVHYYLSEKDPNNLDTSKFLLFINHLSNSEKPLSRFLFSLFNKQGFHGFYIRGLYLTGSISSELMQKSFDQGNPISTRGPAFIRDLFFEKVYSESSLVQISVNSTASSFSSWLFVIKRVGLVALLASVISIPFTAYFFLDRVKTSERLINEFYELLRFSKEQRYSEEAFSFFSPNSTIIEDIFKKINILYDNRLFSIALPASWISSVDSNIKEITNETLRQYLFNYLPYALHKRVENEANALQAKKLSGLEKFRSLVKVLYNVQDQIQSYKNLRDRFDSVGLHAFLNFVFKGQSEKYDFLLKQDFSGNRYVKNLELPKLNENGIEKILKESLIKISNLAISETYIKSPLMISLERVVSIADDLGSLTSEASYEDLLELNQHVDRINSLSKQKEYDWLILPEFKQDRDLLSILNSLAAARMVGIQGADEVRLEAQKSAELARRNAENLNSLMIGDLMRRTQDGLLETSPDFEKFSLNIKEIFNKRFIRGNLSKDSANNLSVGNFNGFNVEKYLNTPLSVNPIALNDAVQLINEYQLFFGSESYGFNPLFLKGLTASSKQLVINNLYQTLGSLFEIQYNSINPIGQSISNLETVVDKKIVTLRGDRKNIDLVLKFLESYNKTDRVNQKYYQDFLLIFESYLLNLLNDINSLLQGSNLYSFLFDYVYRWDPDENLFFDLQDTASGKLPVTQRMIATRKRLNVLYNNYASHVLDLLFELKNIVRSKDQVDLIEKWSYIGENLVNYDQSTKEQNSLLHFEEFIRQDALNLNVTGCRAFTQGNFSTLKSDYFGVLHNKLVDLISATCKKLITKKSYEKYQELQEFFEKEIQGKFPFSLVLTPKNSLSLAVFNDFIGRFNEFYEKYILDTEIFSNAVQSWVDQILKVKSIFNVQENGQLFSNLKIDFSVDFGQVTLDQGADQIIDWELNVGNQVITDKSENNVVAWFYQLPITVQLRWAKNSDFAPVEFKAISNYFVQEENKKAIFRFNNAWSLFELIYKYSIDNISAGDVNDGTLLSFSVPAKSIDGKESQNTVVYIRIRFKEGDKFTFLPFNMPDNYQKNTE